ncbi:glycosyltransferase [Cellulosimicrobium sp. CUA-896]|uniref:glycosyltransferase n=1 Tax=Cellulosimicrobium sp. CUA-896 TaxID=1517881 RepID=UPI00210179AA|nr:glycosyltransferase [Cellulosimicrobium sp. CUA-896]
MLQQPWRLPVLLLRLLGCWAELVVGARRTVRTHGRPEVVLVGYMGHFDVVLARVLFPRSTVVLDHLVFAGDTATDRGAAGLKVRMLHLLDRLATRCADLVLTDTDEHRRMLRRPGRGVVVPVGAPQAWFDAAPAPVARHAGGSLRVVFFGLYTPLQGAPVIGAALAAAVAAGAPIQVTMVGTGQDLPATRRAMEGLGDVTWLEWVEPADLPALVASHDVCLGIFSSTPKGLRVVPNKVYQGLAAGCVVVTSDTRPQRDLLGEHVELVPPADPDALAARLVRLAESSDLAAARERATAGRASITPEVVVEPLLFALRTGGAR